MAKFVKNTTGGDKIWCGQTVSAAAYYQIEPLEEIKWANDSALLIDIASGDAVIAKTDDGTTDFADVSSAINHLKDEVPKEVSVKHQPAFSDKTINGLSLFNRTHGLVYAMSIGVNSNTYTVTYPVCKFNGLEIIGGEIGDRTSLKVLDSTSGTYTGFADYLLNQFGWDVAIAPDFYRRMSAYDADLFVGMQIKIEYDSVSAKNVYVNYLLHELK